MMVSAWYQRDLAMRPLKENLCHYCIRDGVSRPERIRVGIHTFIENFPSCSQAVRGALLRDITSPPDVL